jgi:iron complex transport system permease protein
MKVTLDLTKLLEEGKITRADHDRLSQLGAAGTGSLAFNILLGFGVIAVSGSAVALVPDAITGIIVGGIVLGAGLALYALRRTQWEVLAHICTLIGALGLAGGVIVQLDASVSAFLGITIGFAAAGIVARSGLLIALAVLALSCSLGARTGYMHATYFLGIEEPTLTIVAFSIVALGTYLISKVLPSAYERLALMAARVSVLLVNFGFWIGSLWGDSLDSLGIQIDDLIFVILWALALIAVGVWAARENRRWVVNIAAIFGAIHFYTQWFERLGANPATVLLAGILALGFALGLWYFNRALFDSGRHKLLNATPG